MDDLWHLRASPGLNRNYSQSNPLSSSQNQLETLSGSFGHPFVQQEVCVIERTIRQESVGANLLNFGLQGSSIKSIRGDVGNSLLALVPGSQHQVRSSYQSVITTQSPLLSSNPHAYQMASGSSPGVSSWPGHVSNMSAGNRATGASSGLVGDSSMNMPGREVTLSTLGREVNLSQYSRMSAEQDCLESSPPRTSGVEMSKHNDNSNDVGGQGPYPPWLTEIISSRQRGQNVQSPTFASGASFPRVSESSRDGSSAMSSLATFAPTLMREARVVCINYDTGQRIGGELYLTQLGLLGVICSCHGSHMSVAKFTQHVGIYSTNPGIVVAMDGTGESLVQWRKTLFSLYGIKVPYDNQGWNWSEGAVSESRPTKYKEVVTQGWQKEVDVSDSGEHLVKSRLTQNWDASVSPRTAAHYPLAQNSGSLGLSSNLGEGCVLNSRETFLKSFERTFRGSSLEFGSCPSTVEDMGENVGRCQGLPDMHSCRSSSTEFINFISGSQQLVAGHAEQQLAVEHQIAVGSRSLLKGLDLTCTDRRESFQHEKDNSLSSFELKLGQPSQQSQPTGPAVSSSGNQMQGVLQRGLDIGVQQNIQNTSATTGAGLHRFSGCEEPSNSRLFNQPSFENTSYMEPNHHSTCRVGPNRGVEGNGSVMVNPSSFKGAEDVSTLRFVENLRERENRLNQCATGMKRWSSVGCVSSSFKLPDGSGMNSEHPAKRWADEAQLQMGVAATAFTHGHQGLDAVLGQEWMSKIRPSENQTAESSGTMAGRGGQAGCGESMIHIQRDCTPPCREVCTDGKEQFAYEDMITLRGTREGQGCVYLNTAKATTTIMKGRILSKVGEDEDVCMKEANQEGNHSEGNRHRVNIAASQRPATQECSSPRGCRLRYFQAVSAQICSCGAKLVGEHSDQVYKGNSLAGNAHAPISVAETDRGFDKKLLNQEKLVATSSSRESNHDTFQWKEMGENFVPENDTIPDATQDDMSSPRPLAEDLLVDVVADVNSGVVVSSKISDKQQDVSEICSKSSENVMSGFSDGVGAEEEVSNAHSVEKMSVGRRAVDGASRMVKCSSSAGVDTGLNTSSQGNHSLKEGSPSSQGNSSLCNGTEGSRTKVKTRSRGSHPVKELAARPIVQGTLVDTGKVEKKRRAMKWKRLDATTGTTDAKRQKLSPSVNVAENFDASKKLMEGCNISNDLGHKNMVGFSPSPHGQDSATKGHKVIVTQGNHAALNEEHDMEVTGVNCTDSMHNNERHLTTTETLVIRAAQSSHPKKAKSSGRSKSGTIKTVRAAQDDMPCNKSTFSDMVTVDPSLVEKSIVKEPAGTAGLIPELTVSAIKSATKNCSTLHMQSGKTGRGVLGRPSPRNATRMVSLNDIMNKPEVVAFATPKDHVKASAVKDVRPHQDGCKASGMKGHPNACALKNGIYATKDGLEAAAYKDNVQVSAMTEVSKSLPANGVNVPSPNEALKLSATEGLKAELCPARDVFKARSSKGGLKAYHEKDGLKVTFAKQGPKMTSSPNGLKAFSGKDDSKAWTSDVSLKANYPNRSLKVSGSVASTLKDSFKESAPKSVVKIPVTVDSLEVAALSACSKAAASKSQPSSRVPKFDMHLPAQESLKPSSRQEVSEASRPKNELKTGTLRDRLKTFASRNDFQDSFCFDVDIGSVPRDVSNDTVFKDGSRSFVPTDSMEAPPSAKTEGKGSRRPGSSLARAVVARDDHYKLSSQVGNSWIESKTTTKSNRQEVRKVRSLYELISEKNLPGTGTGVFEFHDEDMESSGIVKHDSVSRAVLHPDSTFSIPVHFTDSKCLVPRGERSPRGKPAKTNSLFLQRHEAGNIGGGKLGAEPVEIVVSKRLVQNRKPNADTPMRVEKEIVTEARLWPVTPRIWSPQKNKTKCEIGDGTPSSGQVGPSVIQVKEVLGKGILDYNGGRSHKRVAEPEIRVNDFKRQKLIEASRVSQFRSGFLKTRHALPISRPTTPTTPSIDMVGSKIEDNKMRPVTIEDDLTIPGRKKRSQRQKRFDCQVPKGVVECCVCGSSSSEFFNQIVCCSRCPVKVHQACYGVKKIPNSAWCCRTCKATAKDPICVLCGYGGGAMTRAQKALGFLKGLVKVWQENLNAKEKADVGSPRSAEFLEIGMRVDHSHADHQHSLETAELSGCSVRGKATREPSEFDSSYPGCIPRLGKLVPREKTMACNTVSSGLLDSTVVQWVHMVCALWMPGTRCLNFGTMGVFDVSGVSQARRKLVCSICNRKGGACVQCRVAKCGIPFHAWCAHEKGLLQSEIVEDGSDQVGFFGKCLRHGKGGDLPNDNPEVTDTVPDKLGPVNEMSSSCARTEGFAGKLTLEQRALLRRKATRNGSAAVSPEQVAAWLRINERKTCKARRFLKSANTDQKTDHREYLRFKQEQGWRRLSVYKSGIHALGLYTAEFIGRGKMVVEYIGEIVGLRVADKREADYHAGKRMQYQGACYLFRIDRERIIDATRKGGIARFVNHSCSPNCVAKVICVKNQSKVVFFAQRDIYAGEEITYDYQFNFEQEGDKIPCFCGSSNCRGNLN